MDGQPARVSERERANQLPADENKDAGRERQNSHYHPGDGDRGDERHDANEDEINCQQQHADVFSEVHMSLSLNAMSMFHVPVGIVTPKSSALS